MIEIRDDETVRFWMLGDDDIRSFVDVQLASVRNGAGVLTIRGADIITAMPEASNVLHVRLTDYWGVPRLKKGEN